MSNFDTKFIDLLIESLEIISNYTVVGNATMVGPTLVKVPLAKLKLMRANYVKFAAEYEKTMAENFKKLNEDDKNK